MNSSIKKLLSRVALFRYFSSITFFVKLIQSLQKLRVAKLVPQSDQHLIFRSGFNKIQINFMKKLMMIKVVGN